MSNANQPTLQQLTLFDSPTLTYLWEDFLARIYLLLDNEKASMASDLFYFLKYSESVRLKDPHIYSLRTSPDFFHTTEGKRSEPSSNPWMNWGMMRNGRCITALHISHKTESGYSLSDILEEKVPEQYFLSDENENIIKIAGVLKGSFRSSAEVYDTSGVSPCLNTMQGGDRQPKVLVVGNTNPSGNGMNGLVYDIRGIAPTLTTNKGEGNKVYDGDRIRKLTPLECFRLQGYPDEWYYKLKKENISNSQLYKMSGNGVSSPVAKEIGIRLVG